MIRDDKNDDDDDDDDNDDNDDVDDDDHIMMMKTRMLDIPSWVPSMRIIGRRPYRYIEPPAKPEQCSVNLVYTH